MLWYRPLYRAFRYFLSLYSALLPVYFELGLVLSYNSHVYLLKRVMSKFSIHNFVWKENIYLPELLDHVGELLSGQL